MVDKICELTNSSTCAWGNTTILRNSQTALWSMALLGHRGKFLLLFFFKYLLNILFEDIFSNKHKKIKTNK